MHRQGWVQGGSAPCPVSQHKEADSPPHPRAGTALGTAPSQAHPGQGTSDDLSWHRELSWGHRLGQGQGSGLCLLRIPAALPAQGIHQPHRSIQPHTNQGSASWGATPSS